ncbi:ROK family transcriptional regulator [Agromyces atrinae]|uniref:ROK family transcriptional regulator n=1 Tax=Agromyces atrinae TaxID=592376 RepID=UPI001F57B21E|nr:ROK family transcriptional regulator [Agromyces atrinae]MCI2958412.1 ROK family transcriptional regulator [Agromyces atrinae]
MSETTTRGLRRRNRARVLKWVMLNPGATRLNLATVTGLSLATVTNVVGDLIDDGIIEDSGTVPSQGGRPTTTLSVRPEAAHFIGVDVGEHGVAVEVFDLSLNRLASSFRYTSARASDPDAIAADIEHCVNEVLTETGVRESVVGIGLGLPGIVEHPESSSVDDHGDAMLYAQSIAWDGLEVGTLVSHDIPVFADNGASTLALSEHWLGAARGVDHGIVALIGRGIGVGIISGGEILRGRSSSAGEWGHTIVSWGGRPDATGIRGTLEAYVGGTSIADRWAEAGGDPDENYELALAQLIEAAPRDQTAAAVLDDTVELLGVGLANLVHLINPGRIVIGGWAGLALVAHLGDRIADAARRNSLERFAGQFDLVPSHFGRDGVALGAALLVVQEFIDGRAVVGGRTITAPHQRAGSPRVTGGPSGP